MPVWLSVILEIIKVTVPALIVFLTVYYLHKQYLDGQLRLQSMNIRKSQQNETLPVRLQAYERIALYCERISIPSLILRVRHEDMTASDLRLALLISIQKEFEHNITQQVYVSENLWKIVQFARDDTMSVINQVFDQFSPGDPGLNYSRGLMQAVGGRDVQPLDRALEAIRKETAVLIS
ncbi:MAG: hypothetical protein AB8F74_00805 [Saprospiraceae bacterium]